MNIIDAAYRTVHDYPGGSVALGPRVGISDAVLRNKVNPNNGTHHLTLAEASCVMGITGDHAILRALADEHGYVLVAIGEATGECSVLERLLSVDGAKGDLAQAIREAVADDVITANELQRINRAGDQLQETLIILLRKLRAVAKTRRAVEPCHAG